MGKESFQCENCRRVFPIHAENVVELLPIKPYHFEQGVVDYYLTAYNHLLQDRFEWNPLAKAWGSPSTCAKGFRANVTEERKSIERHLGEGIRGLLCDVSGGAGVFSLHFANIANLMVHCDLNIASINEVYEESKRHNLRKILLVRCDYLQMPFASNVFDCMICTGSTTGNGLPHDVRLLAEMIRCTKPYGRFAIDFPNRLRLPPLLALLLPRLKTNSVAYDRSMLEEIFHKINHQVIKFGYVPPKLVPFEKAFSPLDKIFEVFGVPPAKYIVLCQKDG